MNDLNQTLSEIKRIEKSEGAEAPAATFDKEAVTKFTEAASAFKEALEAVEKAQPEAVMKTTAGRAVAVMRAAMLGLEGAMSLVWDANAVDDVVRSQIQNSINLLGGLMAGDVNKTAPEATTETPATPVDPETPAVEPTAKAGELPVPTGEATSAAAEAGANKPEGHEPGNGAPADPENVAWPRDLNTEKFRGNATPEDSKPLWGSDGEPAPA